MGEVRLSDTVTSARNKFHIKDKFWRNFLSECVGTFVLMFLGTSIVAQYHLFRGQYNTWIHINIGWGFTITISVTAVSHISGGHLNPAMSVLFFSMGRLDVVSLLAYIVAQHIGAFLGAVASYFIYRDAINMFDSGIRTVSGSTGTAGVFSTYPQSYMTGFGTYLDQIAGTGMLAFCVLMIIDPRNKIPSSAHPILFGISLLVIGCAFGVNCGYPLNPARDFAPRLLTAYIYGKEVFTYPWPAWFLVPIVATTLGALIGGWFYIILVGSQIPDESEHESAQPEKQGKETENVDKDELDLRSRVPRGEGHAKT